MPETRRHIIVLCGELKLFLTPLDITSQYKSSVVSTIDHPIGKQVTHHKLQGRWQWHYDEVTQEDCITNSGILPLKYLENC